MIKLKDILQEVSTNNGSYSADGGEPDTGFTSAGKERVLGIDDNKPEPWFLRGGYSQLEYPVADNPYGDKKEKAIQQFVVIKKLKNTGVKYDTFQSDVGSWDKYGDKDFSTDFDDNDFDYLK
tara:strand:+ start:94 stop:459 length:366 start_codon:yes stop_codon:yes gene_type:complete